MSEMHIGHMEILSKAKVEYNQLLKQPKIDLNQRFINKSTNKSKTIWNLVIRQTIRENIKKKELNIVNKTVANVFGNHFPIFTK